MKEKDLIKITQYTNSTKEDYKSLYNYDIPLNEDHFSYLFFNIFNRPDFVIKLSAQLKGMKRFGYSYDTLKCFIIYQTKYKYDIIKEISWIEDCIKEITNQTDEMENEVYSLKKEQDQSLDKFEELVSNIRDISSMPLLLINSTTYKKKIKPPIANDDFDQQSVDDQIDDLNNWKDDYWEIEDKIIDYNDLIGVAKSNLEDAEDLLDAISEYTY